MTSILVTWGRQKYQIDFLVPLSTVTLGDLKTRCKELTGVPIAAQKLLFSGAMMKDDLATLESFGIYDGAKIMMMGTTPDKQLATIPSGNAEEYAIIDKILSTVSSTRGKLVPKIDAYDKAASSEPLEEEHKRLQDTHNMLSELLLQALFSLDGIECPSGFEEARKKRKEAVRIIQGLQDRVDRITNVWKGS